MDGNGSQAIRVSDDTYRRLDELAADDESPDDVICRLLNGERETDPTPDQG